MIFKVKHIDKLAHSDGTVHCPNEKLKFLNKARIICISPQGPRSCEVKYQTGFSSSVYYKVNCSADKLVAFLNGSNWQDEERTWTTVEQVYETRWDCMSEPGGARLKAA